MAKLMKILLLLLLLLLTILCFAREAVYRKRPLSIIRVVLILYWHWRAVSQKGIQTKMTRIIL